MLQIPKAPLLLGLAGLLPFFGGAATVIWPLDSTGPLATLNGHAILTFYGITILAFMSGVLWGFATQSPAAIAAQGYALSVLPALWGFFTLFVSDEAMRLLALAVGFLALLPLDRRARSLKEAPEWWLTLRVLLTGVVFLCLMVGALA